MMIPCRDLNHLSEDGCKGKVVVCFKLIHRGSAWQRLAMELLPEGFSYLATLATEEAAEQPQWERARVM